MNLFGFGSNVINTINKSIDRAKVQNESDRQAYVTELIDTFYGWDKDYMKTMIEESISSSVIKQEMKKLLVTYPILSNFINKISMIYKETPERRFLLNGKRIISEKPSEYLDKSKYVVNAELLEKLEGIYSRELCMRIKNAEAITNLLNTAIYKVNFRENKINLDFIPSDQCSIIENLEDPTQADLIYWSRSIWQDTNFKYHKIDEYWNMDEQKIVKDDKETFNTNEAMREYMKYYDLAEPEHNGSGFVPFAVLRSSISEMDFWNMQDNNIFTTIKQINLALTELRYLQRYGSFGLKYVLNANLEKGTALDLTGFVEFKSSKAGVGAEPDTEVGEFKNEGRIKELNESILSNLKFLYSLKNINIDSMITTNQASTAESKSIDKESLKEMIAYSQDIWRMNEETIFKSIISVYNRDNADKLPKGLTMVVDFADVENTYEKMKEEAEVWMMKIQNNINTHVDWMMDTNPDLSEKEAESQFEYNKAFNKEEKEEAVDLEDEVDIESDKTISEDVEEDNKIIDKDIEEIKE